MSDPTDSPAGGMFDKLKGKAKEAIGSAVGNDDLTIEGRLEQDKAEAAVQAKRREAEASQVESEAKLEAELRENTVETQRLEAEQVAREREQQLEAERQRSEEQVDKQFVQRERAVEQAAAREQGAANREEIDAMAERAQADQEAARIEAQAEAARQAAETIDTTDAS